MRRMRAGPALFFLTLAGGWGFGIRSRSGGYSVLGTEMVNPLDMPTPAVAPPHWVPHPADELVSVSTAMRGNGGKKCRGLAIRHSILDTDAGSIHFAPSICASASLCCFFLPKYGGQGEGSAYAHTFLFHSARSKKKKKKKKKGKRRKKTSIVHGYWRPLGIEFP